MLDCNALAFLYFLVGAKFRLSELPEAFVCCAAISLDIKPIQTAKSEKIYFTKLDKLSFRNRDEKKLNFFNFGIDVIRNSKLGASFLVGSDQAVVENFLEEKINYLDMLDIMKSVYKQMKLPEKYSIETSIETINNSYKLTNKLIHDGIL